MERFPSTMSLHLLCLLLLTFGLHVGRADEEDETVRANLLKDQLGAGGRVRALHHEADNNAAAAAAAGELHRITLDTWKDLHQSTPAPTMVPRLYGPFRRVLRSQLPFDREVSTIVPRDKDTRFFFILKPGTPSLRMIFTPCEGLVWLRLTRLSHKAMKRISQSSRGMEKRLKRFLGKHPPCLDSTTSRRMDFAVDPKPGFYVVQVKPVNVSIDYLSVRMHLSTPHPTVIGAAIYPDVLGGNITTKQVEVTTKADDEDEVKPSVEVSWDPVTSAPWSTSTPDRYQYCLVISQDRPHRDNCLLDNEAMGIFLGTGRVADARQTVLEDLAAEDWHKEAQRLLAKDMEREYREKVVHTNCQLGGVYKVIVDGLQPSVAYYVDVFVRDRQTLLSSRYQTSNFTLAMPKPKRTSKAALVPFDILPDSVDMGIGMVAKSGYRKLMLYRPPTQSNDIASAEASGSTRKLYIFVQPCGGVGPIQMLIRPRLLPDEASVDRRKRQSRYETIYMPEEHWPGAVSNSLDDDENDEGDGLVDSGALFVEEVTETKTYEVTLPEWFDVHNATHYVEFEFSSLATRQSRTLVVHVADSLKKFPYPRMPADRTIRALETIRNCNSITLIWNASPDQRVLYCVMQRDANEKNASFEESKELCRRLAPTLPNKRALADDEEVVGEDTDDDDYNASDYQLPSTQYTKPTRKVVCRRYQASKRRASRHLIMQNVRKLEPGRRYVFQVVLTKAKGRSLTYEQVWTATRSRDQCAQVAAELDVMKRKRHSNRIH